MTTDAATVEMTEAARVVLKRMHPDGSGLPLGQAMDDIARANSAGDAVRRAVEEATGADGKTNWTLVGAILLAART